MVSKEIVNQVIAKEWERVRQRYPKLKATPPEGIINQNRVEAYAVAFVFTDVIEFGVRILLCTEEGLRHTVVHEIAHFVEQCYYRKTSHSRTFKQIMLSLGEIPSRLHPVQYRAEIASSVLNKKLFRYTCSCDEHYVSKRMHNSMVRGEARVCKKCNVILTYDK